MTTISTDGFGSLFQGVASNSYGTQATWAIDPVLGDDSNEGTPAAPLATAEEFNRRYQGVYVKNAQTLQLVGNVLDVPIALNGTLFKLGAGLTVSGTLTDVAAGTVTVVAGLGPSSGMPWQVTTTGIVWTSQSTSDQVRFSTGQVAAIVQILDANNVIIGMICAPGISATSVAPTVSSTLTVATRSRALPPIVAAYGHVFGTSPQLIFQNLSFDGGVNAFVWSGSVRTQVYGCELKQAALFIVSNTLDVRGSRWTLTGTNSVRAGSDYFTTTGCVAVGTGSTLFNHQLGSSSHTNLTLNGARLCVNSAAVIVVGVVIRNTAGPVLVSSQGSIRCEGGTITGSTGNTSIGIDLTAGKITYQGSGNKPTVTGASDCRVGGVTRTYSQIPFTALQTDAAPNTVTTLTGNGASIVQE